MRCAPGCIGQMNFRQIDSRKLAKPKLPIKGSRHREALALPTLRSLLVILIIPFGCLYALLPVGEHAAHKVPIVVDRLLGALCTLFLSRCAARAALDERLIGVQ